METKLNKKILLNNLKLDKAKAKLAIKNAKLAQIEKKKEIKLDKAKAKLAIKSAKLAQIEKKKKKREKKEKEK